MKRTIAVNSNCYHKYSIQEAIEGTAKAGFSAIELTATKGWTEHVFPTHSFRELYSVKDMLHEYGLAPIGLSGHTNLMDKTRIQDFVANMRLANFFGSPYILSSVGEAHMEDKALADNAAVVAQVKALVPLLEQYGLTLGIENHGDHGTGAIIKEIVEGVGSPFVVLNYDTANSIFFGGANPVAEVRACADKIGYMHLKDKAGAQKEWNFPALGRGGVDIPGIFAALDEAGNACPMSIEIEFTSEGSKNLDEVNEAVAASAAYLKNIGVEI